MDYMSSKIETVQVWGKVCRSWMEIGGFTRKLVHSKRAAIREKC